MEELGNIAIETAKKLGADFADIRIETSKKTNIEVNNGITKSALVARQKGAGFRSFVDGAWSFGHTSDLTPKGIRELATSVTRLSLATKKWIDEKFQIEGPSNVDKVESKAKKPINKAPIEDKIELARSIDSMMNEIDERIINRRVLYREVWSELFIANSLQSNVLMTFPEVAVLSFCTVKDGTNRQSAHLARGFSGGLEMLDSKAIERYSNEPTEIALELLSSRAVEGGVYDVIVDPALNGGLIHEAFGHACEADSFTSGSSVLEGKLGTAVGPKHINIIDDATMEGHIGSAPYDWEGTKTTKRNLVTNGVLSEYLHSLNSSSKLGMLANGAARAMSFKHPPIPRMSNTFMEPGDWDLDELIEDTKQGVIMCNLNYGYTDSSKGQFMFKSNHGYLIENGEKGQIIRDASIAGLILDILPKIDAVCNDFDYDAGSCGTMAQMVRVMSGGPHARIRQVPIGGQ